MKTKKTVSFFLGLVLAVGMISTKVLAHESDSLSLNKDVSISYESDSEDGETIAGELPSQTYKTSRKDSIVTGTRLSGLNKIVYDSLKLKITQVAEGKTNSTQFIVSLSEMGLEGKKWTAADIGVSALVKNDQITDEAYKALIKKIGLNLNAIHNALISDCTYELYWYDVEKGLSPSGLQAAVAKEDSVYKIYFKSGLNAKFSVSKDYSNGTYTVNTSKISRVKKAIQKAKSIVEGAKNKSDYDKLIYYREIICDSVSYDIDADDESTPYGDPWQLISVFDDDSDTNVVAAGYAKAFKYLCDLSEFNSDISCIMVDGYVGVGDPGDIYHIWNIIKMGDGKRYLVDLMFCDMDDIEDRDCMFLMGYSSGNLNNGYVVTYKTADVYYLYDEDSKNTFSTDELTLSDSKFVPCGGNLYWSYKNNTLTISGEGEMYDWTYSSRAPWDGFSNNIQKIVFDGNITHIGQYSFYGCSSLTDISIPKGATSIGACAFCYCTSLKCIEISNSVVSIGSNAFSYCSSLQTVVLPNNLTSIGSYSFYCCYSLTNISVPEGVTSIGSSAFTNCSSLKNIEIPNSVVSIGFHAFYNCRELTDIVIPISVNSIGSSAFSGCTGLTRVVLNKSVYSTGAFPNVSADIFHYYYNMTYASNGHGSITGKAISYGTDVVDFVITPNDDYILGKITWSDGNRTIELKPDKNGKYVMPDSENDVVINASFKKLWKITISETENGKVTVQNSTAYNGDEITLKVIPNTGYEIENITVNGKEIGGTKFTMPDSDVTVGATFRKSVYTISSTQIGNGTVELSKTSACYKDEVTVTATPASGNKLAYIKVNDEIIQGNAFEMPAKNTSIEVAFAKDHKLTAVVAVKPTCTEDGNVAYYECQDPDCKCGLKYSDKYGLNEIDNIIDPATGHSPEKIDAKAATCTEKGHIEHWKCAKCGCLFSDSEGQNAIEIKDTVIDALGHDLEHVDAKAETYQKDGHIEHYFCKREHCGKKFADSEAKTELTDEEIIIPRKGAAILDEEATVDNLIYKVTNPATDGTGTVTLIGVETKTTNVSIPSTVEIKESDYLVNRIGTKAFYKNTIIKTLTIGGNVRIIDSYAFYGCKNLTKVYGGASLETIGASAFAYCPKLKSFTITSPVLKKISSFAFKKDKKLKTLNIKRTTRLTKSGVKRSLKGSSVKTVKVKKTKLKTYKKYFKKSNSGRRVKVKK